MRSDIKGIVEHGRDAASGQARFRIGSSRNLAMISMTQHRLDPSPDSVHWGHFDAALAPALTIESGDTVTMTSVPKTQKMS